MSAVVTTGSVFLFDHQVDDRQDRKQMTDFEVFRIVYKERFLRRNPALLPMIAFGVEVDLG